MNSNPSARVQLKAARQKKNIKNIKTKWWRHWSFLHFNTFPLEVREYRNALVFHRQARLQRFGYGRKWYQPYPFIQFLSYILRKLTVDSYTSVNKLIFPICLRFSLTFPMASVRPVSEPKPLPFIFHACMVYSRFSLG